MVQLFHWFQSWMVLMTFASDMFGMRPTFAHVEVVGTEAPRPSVQPQNIHRWDKGLPGADGLDPIARRKFRRMFAAPYTPVTGTGSRPY